MTSRTAFVALAAIAAGVLIALPLTAQQRAATSSPTGASFYDLQTLTLDGKPGNLAQYKGEVSLVVNVASKCGFTPQYEGLEKLQRELKDKGFNVLGFPSNDFGEQEPGTAQEIATFCRLTYGVTFPMFEKVVTRQGRGQSPVYALLGRSGHLPAWNFSKYLVDKQGRVVAFYASEVTPEDRGLRMAIAKELSAPVSFAAPASAQERRPATACDQLVATLKLSHTTVTASQAVVAGGFTAPGASGGAGGAASQPFADLPAFCRVQLTIRPSSDSDIKSEVWLPQSGWNGKFQAVGNGAWAGSIQYGALADALRRGYAAASTDAGHTGTDASFALGHPEKLIDFGYRAVHETAVQAKATIAGFYGSAPRLSYFNGCSGGGRMAFQEAQRFPEDFDAILAGAPGYDRVNQSVQMLMNAKATLDHPGSMIPSSKYAAIHRAALAACDAQDGLKDDLISEPLTCRFDPAVLACKGADAADCLTPAQVGAAKKIYAGVTHPKTGALIFPGLEPGSELSWGGPAGGPVPLAVAGDLFKSVVFQDPKWDFRTFDLARDYDAVHKIDNLGLSPTSPDLKPFAARGGRLLIYHGWADMNVAPKSSVAYYERLVKTMGQAGVDSAVRLFFAPGMAHCGGGTGPNVFDALTPLEQWREHGVAPTEIVASHATDGKVDRTRPLCAYPLVARYKGTGSIDQAQNFTCAK